MATQLTGAEPYGLRVSRDAEALGRHCEVLFRSFGTTIVASLIQEHDARSVLDLGCGTGGLILDLCRQYPRLRAIGLDIAPEAVRLGRDRTIELGLSDRVSFVVGDAFTPANWPAGAAGCDFFVAVGTIHEHFRDGEAAVVDLLKRYAALLAEPGRKTLLLAEPEMNVDAGDSDFYLVHVLTAQGMPRRREEWFRVFAQAGLDCTRVFSAPNTGFRFAYYELRAAGR
jgi:SAM-dependent methyltransferase